MTTDKLKIITYHYVRDVERTRWPGIKACSVREFNRQVEYMVRQGSIVSMAELIEAINDGTELPKRAYLLTFDDGYKDHIQNVLPILKKWNVSAAFFLPGQAVADRRVLYVNKIQLIVATEHPDKLVKLLNDRINHYRVEYQLKDNDEYWLEYGRSGKFDGPEIKYFKNMLQFGLPKQLRQAIIDELFGVSVSVDEAALAEELYLNGNEVKILREAGMHIGNHTDGHGWLGKMAGRVQEQEIDIALDKLRGLLSEKWTMCYPYGNYNKKTIELLVAKGCQAAFTTERRALSEISKKNRYKLSRLDTNDLRVKIKTKN